MVAGSSLSIVLNPKHCVEVLLRNGRRLTFGNLLDREGTIRLLRAARTQAQHEQTSGLRQWRPRRIELHEPLSVHNLLPCTLHATLTQQGEWRGGGPTATPVRGPEAGAVGGAVADTSAAGLIPTELRPALVEVYDWWDPHLKQLTFHAGEAWGREERTGAGSDTTSRLARKPRAHPRRELRLEEAKEESQLPATPRTRSTSSHPNAAPVACAGKDVQFLALGPRAEARDDTVAVLDWWDPDARKLVIHPTHYRR